jgi:hypothetical protein
LIIKAIIPVGISPKEIKYNKNIGKIK